MSFKITARTLAEVREDLGADAPALDAVLQAHPVAAGSSDVEARPWVQLAYHEIDKDDLQAVLSYAGITMAGSPIGLPCATAPIEVPPDAILFSTQALRASIEQRFGSVLGERAQFASLREFLEARELSAAEYLATAVVDACVWCESHGHALVIRW